MSVFRIANHESRELACVMVTDLADWPSEAPAKQPFVALLALDALKIADEGIDAFAARLLDQGVVYVCCWGPDCSRVHDRFDIVDLERGALERPDDKLIMTTLHPHETLADALYFALNDAWPSDAYVTDQKPALVAVTNRPEWANEIAEVLCDPRQFSARLLREE